MKKLIAFILLITNLSFGYTVSKDKTSMKLGRDEMARWFGKDPVCQLIGTSTLNLALVSEGVLKYSESWVKELTVLHGTVGIGLYQKRTGKLLENPMDPVAMREVNTYVANNCPFPNSATDKYFGSKTFSTEYRNLFLKYRTVKDVPDSNGVTSDNTKVKEFKKADPCSSRNASRPASCKNRSTGSTKYGTFGR